jgi:VWFA-related protein
MSRLLLVALGILTSVSALYGQDPVPQRHIERVEVPRVLIDARVVDGRGFPIRGLAAGDFRVTIDGKPARVESAFWSGEQREVSGEAAPAGVAADLPPEAKGRLIVFLFQKDMDVSRLLGLMRMLIRTRLFLDSLGPDDRVAVLSFDSHLKVWVDFTSDLDRVRHIFDRGILFEDPPRLAASPGPSLLATLDVVQGRKAFTIEKGLALLGRALEPLPGSKSVVMVGHGFGELVGGNTVFVDQAYAEARRSLQAARATVFSLDVTDADAHTMEVGLKTTAADTGGFFARTHQFPGQAIERLAGALAGHYVLFVEVEQALERSRHEIAVTLAEGVKGEVLAKRHYSSRN